MGGYGAAYLGTRFGDLFDAVGIMGGPTDWDHSAHLLYQRLGGFLPEERSLPFTFEALDRGVDGSPFARGDYLVILKDLTLIFGNLAVYNPDNSYWPPGVLRSDPVALERARSCNNPVVLDRFYDWEYNNPSSPYCATYPGAIPPNTYGLWPVITFCDGGGRDDPPYAYFDPSSARTPVEIGLSVDCNGNKRRDPGEPVIRQFWEPWQDTGSDGIPDSLEPGYDPVRNPDPNGDNYHPLLNPLGTEGNLRYDPGEPFVDGGLDGIIGLSNLHPDPFEGNGVFDRNPNFRTVDRLNPRLCLKNFPPRGRRYYLDAGVKDPFAFGDSALRFLGTLKAMGEDVEVAYGFDLLPERTGSPDLWHLRFTPSFPHLLVLYGNPSYTYKEAIRRAGDGGHVGTFIQVVERLLVLFQYVTSVWDLPRNPTAQELLPYERIRYHSRILGVDREITITLPPGFDPQQPRRYPVLYFLHGHGMDPEDTAQGGALLGLFMAQGIIPPMIIAYPDGRAVHREQGSFFVNHFDTSGQDPFAYADAFIHEVIPLVETRYPVLSDPSQVETYPLPDTGCEVP
jgi:hypothetical protein